ncbi:unnamed protein product [Meloidogyne enterolobii]|uniref:Uncharacterized protein n=1 Tax=Meloidogyne enterolobii TaxID=390850 RepID=A0ACB0Z8K6_MELEN
MSQLILSSIQKLMSIQIGLETKRLLLEFCEVVIKWEQDRQQQLNLSSNSNCKVEHVVVELGDDNDDNVAQQQQPSTSSNIENEPSIPLPPDSNKEMDKNFIDTVIMFLFRMATSTDQFSTSSGGGSSALEQINRRALLLLRVALKPNIFGNVVTIRTNLFEKQLQLPNPEQFSTANETAINQQLQLVNITLDVLSNIIPHLSQQLLVDLFRPLQRSLICCMSYSNSQQILRSTYNILGKLLDKTTKNNAASMTPPPGLNDFDLLNQHISRCIHDAFNNYACSLTASPPMTVITLLRLMHSAQSNYLETVCLGSFVKLLQRLVREYVATNFTYSATTAITPIQQHDLQAQKLIGDLLSICLELLCSRTRYFNTEAQKTIVQFVIIPLIEKGAADKIIENVIKIATEILTSEVQLISEPFQQQLQQITSTPQPNIKIQSLGAQVLIKLFSTLESRLTNNFELKNLFLNAIILLYENSSSLMLSGSDGLLNIEIIQPAFYWGLCCVDKELRKRFFTIHQRLFPPNLFARLIYIFTNERWDLLNSSTTNSSSSLIIAHLINLLLNANKSTEWIENFVDLLYIDPLLCQQTFIELFTSIWSNLNENEREKICSFITPFLTSSAFCIPTTTTKNGGIKKEDYFEEDKEENFVISTILKALIKCKKPEIEIDPVVLSYVGSNFKCWHIALLKLEKIAISKKALISNIGGEITTSAWNAATNLTEEKLDTLDSLTRLYQLLNEFDQYNFVWRKRACFEKTIKCLAFYQQGDYVRARETAEKLMLYLNEKLFKSDSLNAVTPAILSEFQIFENCWIDSCKQLNDWTSLEAFSNSDEVANINLLTETAWHLSDWKLLKDCLIQLDAAGDPSMTIKSSLYKLMIKIANFDQLDGKAFEEINKMLITNWKKLPSIISHSHLEILNLAHFTHEVCESANVVNNNLQSINFPSQNGSSSSSSSNNLNTSVKHLLKSWRFFFNFFKNKD